jgi:gamma-glutamylcyclotransferase (GGCT)/AIG2-like uncharacterized protein YtfP
MDVFVYGTLMDPQLVLLLTGRTFALEPARLPDYRRFEPKDSYPYILPCAGDVVVGALIRDVDTPALRQLDQYEGEGDLYVRTDATVETESGPHRCAVYVANPTAIGRLRLA